MCFKANLESWDVLEFLKTLESRLNIETISPSGETLIPSDWELGRKWLYLKAKGNNNYLSSWKVQNCSNRNDVKDITFSSTTHESSSKLIIFLNSDLKRANTQVMELDSRLNSQNFQEVSSELSITTHEWLSTYLSLSATVATILY